MTDPEDVWAEVARRAAVSRFSGATADDDDVLVNQELREAQLNPNRQGGQGGVGGPGMMPPMMMGGMGAGGAGGAAPSGGGLGGGAAAAAASSTRPPQASTGLGVQAAQAPLAEEVPEEPEVPGIGGGVGGGGTGGGLPEGGAPAGGGAGPADGFSADPVAVRGIASKWAELAQEIHSLESPAFDAALGLVLPPERPQQAVTEQVRAWSTGAGAEFDALVSRLHDVAAQYEAVEETGAAEIRKETADG